MTFFELSNDNLSKPFVNLSFLEFSRAKMALEGVRYYFEEVLLDYNRCENFQLKRTGSGYLTPSKEFFIDQLDETIQMLSDIKDKTYPEGVQINIIA